MTTITLNCNELAILRALVERAALDTPLGLRGVKGSQGFDFDGIDMSLLYGYGDYEDTEAYLQHALADPFTLSRFVSKARELLS